MASSYSTLSTKVNERLTIDQIRRKRAIADALASRGFQQTQVAPGGQYTPFAGIADVLSSVLGTYTGNKQNKELDAREAELAAQQQAIKDELVNASDPMQAGQQTLSPNLGQMADPALAAPEPVTQPVTPAPGPDAIAPLPVAPTANPMHQQLAQALMSAVPDLAQNSGAQAFPLANTPSPQGEGFQAVADAMKGRPPGTIPPIVQDSPGFTQTQQDQVGDIEAASMLGDNPDYPPEIVPPGPPIEIGANGVGTMPPMTVTGRRPPPPALLEALMAQGHPVSQQPGAAPQQSMGQPGTPPPPELVQALMEKNGLGQPTAPIAPPNQQQAPARQGIDWQRMYKAAVRAGDSEKAMFALKQLSPEMKQHVIDGSLVDSSGKVVFQGQPKAKMHVVDGALVDDYGRVIYKGTPEQLKVVQEFNAMLDQSGITDPAARQKMWADYAGRKGSGGNTTVTFGGPTAGVDAQGNPVFFQPSNKGGAPNIMEGVAPAPKEEKPLTEAQGKAASYGLRAKESDKIMSSIEGNPNTGIGSVKHWAMSKAPGGNFALTEDQQKYNQAAREFISAAVLRSDSGATVTAADYAQYYPIFFPMPGDSTSVKKQKADSRRTALEGLDVMAGIKGQKAQQREQGKDKPQTTDKSGVNPAAVDMERERLDAGEPAPPSDLPAGTTLYKTLPNGNPVWLLPNGSKREQHM